MPPSDVATRNTGLSSPFHASIHRCWHLSTKTAGHHPHQPRCFPFTTPRSKRYAPLPPPQKRVLFHWHINVQEVLHRRNYSSQEREESWYDKTEIRRMKRQMKEDAANAKCSDYENGQMRLRDTRPFQDVTNHGNNYEADCTVRGLEKKTFMGSIRRKRHRFHAWQAVFAEQLRQKNSGISDPDTLADIYFEMSEPCHVAANMQAIRDAREVQYLNDLVHSSSQENQQQ